MYNKLIVLGIETLYNSNLTLVFDELGMTIAACQDII